MAFPTIAFLLVFLPVVLLVYPVLRSRRLQNVFLLLASLLFYAWGEGRVVLVMLASIAVNYGIGLWIETSKSPRGRKIAVALAVAWNMGLLVVFKYLMFLGDTLGVSVPAIALPIGISFFSFQALSYVVDVYRADAPAQKNPLDFGLYIALFPQLIAGPIVRYRDIAKQLLQRTVTREGLAFGVYRFTAGLSKKLLIADPVGQTADSVFALAAMDLSAPVAWLGVICYSLQIYFDFSGYSDMAIGIGRMFGFVIPENFLHPYSSQSVTEFWRRWHVSLSTWFRDYLYIPLGGNRAGAGRTYFNLGLVFVLCGLWHGAAWTFVFWGLYHGLFLILERRWLKGTLDRLPRAIRHVYLLLVVIVGWSVFRAESISEAVALVGAMSGLGAGDGIRQTIGLHLSHQSGLALIAGVLLSVPWVPWLRGRWAERSPEGARRRIPFALHALGVATQALLLWLCLLQMVGGTQNPFIYFRF